MIKLDRNFTPLFFTPANVIILTNKYKSEAAHVWQNDEVKTALANLSCSKCAYCEVLINQSSAYLEVEHFKDKKSYPDDVINWENLLPSCRHCNGSKGTHDVIEEPIINPFTLDPKKHLYFFNYRIKGKDDLGKMTVEALNLNDREHFVEPRFKVGNKISSMIEDALDLLTTYKDKASTQRKNKLLRAIRALLLECQSKTVFSAVSATILHANAEYDDLRKELKLLNLWSEELNDLDQHSLEIKLDTER